MDTERVGKAVEVVKPAGMQPTALKNNNMQSKISEDVDDDYSDDDMVDEAPKQTKKSIDAAKKSLDKKEDSYSDPEDFS